MDVPEKYVESILNDFDYKNNGKIELDEFCALMAKSAQSVDADEEMKDVFALFDTQKNGKVTKD